MRRHAAIGKPQRKAQRNCNNSVVQCNSCTYSVGVVLDDAPMLGSLFSPLSTLELSDSPAHTTLALKRITPLSDYRHTASSAAHTSTTTCLPSTITLCCRCPACQRSPAPLPLSSSNLSLPAARLFRHLLHTLTQLLGVPQAGIR